MKTLGAETSGTSSSMSSPGSTHSRSMDSHASHRRRLSERAWSASSDSGVGAVPYRSRALAGEYDETTNAGVDVFFSSVALPALYAALPATVWMLDDDYFPTGEVCTKLHENN